MGEAVRSDMSVDESCRRYRLRESQFYWWRRQLKPGWQQRVLRRPKVPEDAASVALVSKEAGARNAGI
jgi:transposase-like protein